MTTKKGVWWNGEIQRERVSDINASADGSFVWYLTRREGKIFVHLNGKIFGGYEAVLQNPQRTQDKAHVWYQAKKAGRVYLHLDGREWGGYENIGELHFLPGTKSFWFAFAQGGQTWININGQEQGKLSPSRRPVLRPDGSVCGWVRKPGKKWFVEITGKNLGGFLTLDPEPVFSPDGSRFSFGYTDETGRYLNVGGHVFGVRREKHDSYSQTAFSQDVSRGALAFQYGGKTFFNLDGRVFPAGERIINMGFSPEGKKFWCIFYRVQKGKRRPSVRTLLAEEDLSGFEPHALALVSDGAVLARLDSAGTLRLEHIQSSKPSATKPKLQTFLAKQNFSWGEPMPLKHFSARKLGMLCPGPGTRI
jgi:hypothetical protein